MTEWQPIETAPRDHFPVLAWSVRFGRIVAFRDINWEWWPCPADEPLSSQPTHWMPLPAPPKEPALATAREVQQRRQRALAQMEDGK